MKKITKEKLKSSADIHPGGRTTKKAVMQKHRVKEPMITEMR